MKVTPVADYKKTKRAEFSQNIYERVGKVVEAGGTIVSVDEGRLRLPIRTTKEGKIYG